MYIYRNYTNMVFCTMWYNGVCLGISKKHGAASFRIHLKPIHSKSIHDVGTNRIYRILHTYLPMKMKQCVPKCQHVKFRRQGITQKKAHQDSEHGESLKSRKTQYATQCKTQIICLTLAVKSQKLTCTSIT
jgi:hypothetical protein